jgi:dephospho-CoA kinase
MMTFILGITGGIASGKTTATKTLETLGIQVVDADVIARNIVSKGSAALKKITQHFGASVLIGPDSESDSLDSGELNRTRLREIIFSDPEEKHWLENLLHPLAREKIIQQLSTITSPYGVLSSPLLFEKNQRSLVDRTLVIDTPTSTQKVRAAQRDNTNQQQIERIIHSQLSREKRNKQADDIIMNTGSVDELRQAVTAYHHQLLPKV